MYETQNQYLEENELQHYGILGMKWGVRRTPEQLGHRKQKTSEQIAKSQKRKATIKKVAKFTAKTTLKLGFAAIAAYVGGNVLMSATAGTKAAEVGAKAVASQLTNRQLMSLAVSELGDRTVSGYQTLDAMSEGELTRMLLNRY